MVPYHSNRKVTKMRDYHFYKDLYFSHSAPYVVIFFMWSGKRRHCVCFIDNVQKTKITHPPIILKHPFQGHG